MNLGQFFFPVDKKLFYKKSERVFICIFRNRNRVLHKNCFLKQLITHTKKIQMNAVSFLTASMQI